MHFADAEIDLATILLTASFPSLSALLRSLFQGEEPVTRGAHARLSPIR